MGDLYEFLHAHECQSLFHWVLIVMLKQTGDGKDCKKKERIVCMYKRQLAYLVLLVYIITCRPDYGRALDTVLSDAYTLFI